MKLTKLLLIWVSTCIIVAVANYFLVFQLLEAISYDWRMTQIRSEMPANDNIVVVMIDDNSLEVMDQVVGRWPWPRSIYAELLEYLSYGEPQAVMFDITFSEKHRFDGNILQEEINEHDLALVQTSQMHPYVYHAARFVRESEDELNKSLLNQVLPKDFAQRFALSKRFAKSSINKNSLAASSNTKYYLPFKELAEATNGIGVVDVNGDSDGVYRAVRLLHKYQDSFFPALSISSILDQHPPAVIKRIKNTLFFDALKIPITHNEKVLINYYTEFKTYSFSALMASYQKMLEGNIDNLMVSPFDFKDKIVFIGASAAGLQDLKVTPVDSRLPGVLIHASMTSNILNNDFLVPAKPLHTYLLIVILAGITAFGVLRVKQTFLQHSLPIIFAILFSLWAYFQFTQNIVVEYIAPISSLFLAWILSFSALVFTEGKEKRRFKKMMSQYLSPAVLNTVMANHEDYAKAEIGSKENITILFSDIRSFTKMAEKLPAEQVVDLLNHYFSKMTDSIFRYEGTIDKFIGDAIMAFWGAPIMTDDHPDKATLSALEMIEKLDAINAWARQHDYPALTIGIGLHTGNAILGNIGSENKLDYTIIGDNVNLASRIEGLTKLYSAPILITEDTFSRLKTNIPCRIVDLVRVKGKQNPIKVYQPLINPLTSTKEKIIEKQNLTARSNAAFEAYTQRQWQQCIALLTPIANDPIAAIYIQRCQQHQANEPAQGWDGVYTMTTK